MNIADLIANHLELEDGSFTSASVSSNGPLILKYEVLENEMS